LARAKTPRAPREVSELKPSRTTVVALSLLFLVSGSVIFASSYYTNSGTRLGYHNVPVSLAKALSPLVVAAVVVLVGRKRNR
jgi:hypothetical protein